MGREGDNNLMGRIGPKNLMLALSVLLVTGVVSIGGCVGSETVIEYVTPREAVALIQDNQNNPDFEIIDVRTTEEFAEGYIENASMMDFYSETFQNELGKLDKDKTYLIYCRSGNRSGKTLDVMYELNFREVYNMLGGITRWTSEGLPIIK